MTFSNYKVGDEKLIKEIALVLKRAPFLTLSKERDRAVEENVMLQFYGYGEDSDYLTYGPQGHYKLSAKRANNGTLMWVAVATWYKDEEPDERGLLYCIKRALKELDRIGVESGVELSRGTLTEEEHKALEIIDA